MTMTVDGVRLEAGLSASVAAAFDSLLALSCAHVIKVGLPAVRQALNRGTGRMRENAHACDGGAGCNWRVHGWRFVALTLPASHLSRKVAHASNAARRSVK